MPETRPPESTFAGLENELWSLGKRIAYPSTPDLAASVRSQLDIQLPMAAPPPRAVSRRLWLAAAAVLLILGLGVLALMPNARTAIANRLGLPGVQFWWLEEMATPEPLPAGADLQLGRVVTLEEAATALTFPPRLPTLPGFGSPAAIYLLGTGDEAMVSFVYPARPGLPASAVPGAGALLTQFRGALNRPVIEKGLRDGDGDGDEAADPTTILEPVAIGEATGFWLAGAPHGVLFVCPDTRDCRAEPYRLAGNVLLWEVDGVTYRLESALSRDDAVAIATSLAPVN